MTAFVMVRPSRGGPLSGATAHLADCDRLKPLTIKIPITEEDAARALRMGQACPCVRKALS